MRNIRPVSYTHLQSNENQNKYSDASIGLDELKQMKEDQEQYVQGLKYELEDDKNAKRKDLNEWRCV